ncbi:hypothetical protein CYPRO_1308 [Cyclonatronum proteinivorum]|uniref:AB hydrolase-1 domain-containing protein n=1 Tax=Cyclonatronum proteinivorum TaxID=1457365 RepID=A0A345UJB3_9BACT|nr:alpha/beta fold hydrolase [Cyclonatronum proteinivorum]AXJ00565.1 hypothetical protein CYPRO_1308 [Cyclonatronum proteinivorum]
MNLPSPFHPAKPLWNGHLETIYPSLFRKVPGVLSRYERERLELPDGDFVDIDRIKQGAKRAVIISHGLEGNSHRAYVTGMATAFAGSGWDVLAWNFRGCSGVMNRLPRFYHSGDTTDLLAVVHFAADACGYDEVVLVGFSMGGNMTLKLAGEQGDALPQQVSRLIAFSVPCDLAASAKKLEQSAFGLYQRRFMRMLKTKIRQKEADMPGTFDLHCLSDMHRFREFDDTFTAPLHGFRDANDYWTQASCLRFLPDIRRPALLVSARNDPFLTPECYPEQAARQNPHFTLEMPARGGHTGFTQKLRAPQLWSEQRALHFAEQRR